MDKANVPMVRYMSVLEDYHAVSQECRELNARLQAEFNFAEEKIREIELYKEFISSDDNIQDSYNKFVESKSQGKEE